MIPNNAASRISDEKQLEILSDHYKETFDVVKLVWSQRNHVALYLYLLAAFLLNPNLHQTIIKKYLGESPALGSPTVYLIGLLGLLALCILLTQRTTFLDRHYIYLQGLEDRMKKLTGYTIVAREGDFYTLKRIPEKDRVRMPIRYDWLYDGVLVLLVAGVLINLWVNIFFDNSCQYGLFYQGAFALISLAFLAVLGLFYFYRDKIKDVARAMNKLLDEEMTPSQ